MSAPLSQAWPLVLTQGLTRGWAGVLWYLRAVTGESRWDDYREHCRREGVEPMSRRDFERHRDRHRERAAQGRCC